MLKTWTDTHYKLEDTDWLYIAKHDEGGAASLICPGYARDGSGFSIHFTPAHIEILQNLLALLQSANEVSESATPSEPAGTNGKPWVEMYPASDAPKTEDDRAQDNGYKYPNPTPATSHRVIR